MNLVLAIIGDVLGIIGVVLGLPADCSCPYRQP
jgi:hypothetical protein